MVALDWRTPLHSLLLATLLVLPCRHGFNLSNHSLGYYGADTISQLAGAHTYHYSARLQYSNPTGLEVYQVVPIYQGQIAQPTSEIKAVAIAHPGALWLMGNEPENIHQGNSTPEQYAVAYHTARELVLSYDPTARFAIGAVTQATPLRLEWLDRVVAEHTRLYGSKPQLDWFNVHGYQFNETAGTWGAGIPVGISATHGMQYTWDDTIDIDSFSANIVRVREWMAINGYQDVPLMISEYGPGSASTYAGGWEQVAQYALTSTMGYMVNARSIDYGYPADSYRLVQRFNYFALDQWPGMADSVLVYTSTRKLTPLGTAWVRYVHSPQAGLAPCTPNLLDSVYQVFSPWYGATWN